MKTLIKSSTYALLAVFLVLGSPTLVAMETTEVSVSKEDSESIEAWKNYHKFGFLLSSMNQKELPNILGLAKENDIKAVGVLHESCKKLLKGLKEKTKEDKKVIYEDDATFEKEGLEVKDVFGKVHELNGIESKIDDMVALASTLRQAEAELLIESFTKITDHLRGLEKALYKEKMLREAVQYIKGHNA